MKTFDPNHFDAEFYKRTTGLKGAKRWIVLSVICADHRDQHLVDLA